MQFSPSVYEHAARVIGKSPWEVSRSADLLAEGNIQAFHLYHHAPVVVGHPVPCVMGGDTTPILDAILETPTGYVCCPAGTDQKMFMEKMKAHPDVMVRINMDPRPMTAKNFNAVKKEVDRVLELANNRDKVCIGTGCLPFETDPEMVLRTKEYILTKNVP